MVCLSENTVAEFVDGSLAPEAAARLEAHVASCAACRRLLSELAKGPSTVEPSPRSLETAAASGPATGHFAAPSPVSDPHQDLGRGALVGRYVVLETLGAGGMGVVYAAYDPELDRKVALKLLRREMLGRSHDLTSRMTREAKALARLSHPNVVTVYDVGTSGASVFIAMELIGGVTLGRWLSQKERSWRDIVETFTKAGRGLMAAHAAGFIHRDFKPANVLVSEDGGVRVVDFGLVRSRDAGADAAPEAAPGGPTESDESLDSKGAPLHALTQTGAVLGTPAYMAPEQFEPGAVDARADQFSFCVALFEALSGQRPFTVNTREVIQAEAPKGKLALPPGARSIPPFLRGPLERGLRLAPEDRFPSMAELLAALAKDPQRTWRRWGLVAASALAVGLAGFAAARLRSQPAPLCQGAPAKLAPAWNDDKKRALHEHFVATGLSYSEDTWAEVSRALDAYGRDWAAMHTEACEATRVRGEQSDEVLSLRMLCLDRRLAELRALSDVMAATDAKGTTKAVEAAAGLTRLAACADVEALRTPVRAPEGDQAAATAREIEAELAQAGAHKQLGQFKEALEIASRAAERARSLGHLPTEAEALERLGEVRLQQIDPKAAEQTLRAAFATATASRHDRIAARAAIELIFVVGSQMFRFDDGAEWAFHADAALKRAGGDPELEAQMHANVGSLFYNKGDLGKAKEEYAKSLAMREKLFGPEHRQVVQSLELVAMVAGAQGDHVEASRLSRRSTELSKKLYGARHPAYGESLKGLAIALLHEDRDAEALAAIEESLSVVEAARGRDHPHVGVVLLTMGNAKRKLGRHQESLDALKRARSIFEKVDSARPFVADAVARMAETQKELGHLDEALALDLEALAILEEVFGPDYDELGNSLVSIGATLLRQGKAKEALERCTRALAVWEKAKGADVGDNAEALLCMGEAHLALHQAAKATPLLERAQALLEKHGGDEKLLARARALLAPVNPP